MSCCSGRAAWATIRGGTCEALVQVENAVGADVAGDGRLAVISGDRVSLLEQGTPSWYEPLTGALDVVFSPDGRLLVTGGMEADVRVYDAGTGELIARLLGHGQRVAVVAFSPDSHTLASGSGDGTVRLWSMERLADDPVQVVSELVEVAGGFFLGTRHLQRPCSRCRLGAGGARAALRTRPA